MASFLQHTPRGLRGHSLRRQLPWASGAVALTITLIGLALLAEVISEGSVPSMDLLSDPAEVTGIPWYVGAVSDLNLFVWAAGVAVYLVAALGLRRTGPRLAAALGWLGAVTVVFLADDRFLLHEIVYPWLFGLPETVTYLIYAAVLGLLLLWYRRVLLAQPEAGLLLLALLALAASVVLDVLGWDSDTRRVAEEAAKLLGATAWTLFPAAIIVRHLHGAGSAQDASPSASIAAVRRRDREIEDQPHRR